MIPAEFEERAYEAPLYNQLERGDPMVYTPGQVLESRVGFDRGLFIADSAVWQTLGYAAPLAGAALAYYDWSASWGPPDPRHNLPPYKLNLFLQAKRCWFYPRRPRALRAFPQVTGPLWAFRVEQRQQKLLEELASRLGKRAHIAYAAPAFHTNTDLFRHTRFRTIISNSTFPPASELSNHDAWYYGRAGASGVANPNPTPIEALPLLDRLRQLTDQRAITEQGTLFWVDELATDILAVMRTAEGVDEGVTAQFFDNLQTLERTLEPFALAPTIRAYAQIRLFTTLFTLTWLVAARA